MVAKVNAPTSQTDKGQLLTADKVQDTDKSSNKLTSVSRISVKNEITLKWQKEFIERIRIFSKSRKLPFTYTDAVQKSLNNRTPFDEVMISYLAFINKNPLNKNDYFKFVNAYRNGTKLNKKYFRHDVNKLNRYYSKIDADRGRSTPFNLESYETYVLFMMLKLEGVYKAEFDTIFNVKTIGGREYNPLTNIPSVLRGELPFKVKEFDIARAYPTFIDKELNIEDRNNDVYDIIDKVEFNTLLNMHHNVRGSSISNVREKLFPVYGNRVNEVITEARFNEQGKMFKDLVKYESKAIEQFIYINKIKNYVRLHDGVFVKSGVKAEVFEFDKIRFAIKECIKPPIKNNIENFYYYDEYNNLQTSPKQYADFFEQEKFVRVQEIGNDSVIILKDSNNVVSPFNHKTETVKFLKEQINEVDSNEIENRIARESQKAIAQGFLLLPSKELKYYIDSKTTFGLPFKNGFFSYTGKDADLECLDYKEVNGFFAPHKVQSHTFIKVEEPDISDFERFLTMVSTGKDPQNEDLTLNEKDILLSFCTMVGYLCHTYKNRSFSPAIILTDEGANDISRNGGRGKTILANAISHVQPSITKGGQEFQPNYIHNFADLDVSRRVYILDDVPAGFNYNELYTNIVGSISCQRKGAPAQEIPFEYVPKFVITTNYAVRYNSEDTSTNRRFLEYKFTDYFNLENKPKDVFGYNLFDDWDSNEWNRFYNFIYYCVGVYIQQDIKSIDYDKTEDNFIANFSKDGMLDEFERIFKMISSKVEGFGVYDFLEIYNDYQNPLKNEKLFHTRNVKKLMNVYISKHDLRFVYTERTRKWTKI